MNDKRRTKISEVKLVVSQALTTLENIKDDEEDALWNIPENLQTSDRYYEMEEHVNNLIEAIEKIEQGVDCLGNII